MTRVSKKSMFDEIVEAFSVLKHNKTGLNYDASECAKRLSDDPYEEKVSWNLGSSGLSKIALLISLEIAAQERPSWSGRKRKNYSVKLCFT